MSEAKRNIFFDAVRGLAAMLVVLGHALYFVSDNPDGNQMFKVIYSFHMPLFMFISGYVTYKPERRFDFEWIKKKTTTLLIPFLTWILLSYILGYGFDFSDFGLYIVNIIKRPDNANWFLWVLFLNCCLIYMGMQIKYKFVTKPNWVILLGLTWVLNVVNILIEGGNGWLGIGMFAWQSVFFVMGYLIAEYARELFFKMRYGAWLCLGIYILMIPYWRRSAAPIFLDGMEEKLNGVIRLFLNKGFNYIIAFLGIAIIFYLVSCLPLIVKRMLAYLGKYTLEIYVLHLLFFELVKTSNRVVNCVLMMIAGIVGPLLAVKIIGKGIIGKLLFGKNYNNT